MFNSFSQKTVSLTDITRIKHTINTLNRNADLLQHKLNQQKQLDLNDEIIKDNYRHALEIAWGWEELKSSIDALPEYFIDKSFFMTKAKYGISQSISLIEKARSYLL